MKLCPFHLPLRRVPGVPVCMVFSWFIVYLQEFRECEGAPLCSLQKFKCLLQALQLLHPNHTQ